MMENLHQVVERIEGAWKKAHVLVIGDLMLDRYIWGEVERISPEAPVPVVRAGHRSDQPGGAANVAMNIAGLGARATVVGFVGQDAERDILEHCLDEKEIGHRLTAVQTHPTTSKLRILGGQQQVLRLDVEKTGLYPPEASEALQRDVAALLRATDGDRVDAVVLSDYAKGVLSEQVCQEVIRQARTRGIPVLVDPKQRDFSRYAGATTICPNLQELGVATGRSHKDVEPMLAEAEAMVARFGLGYLTVTLSEKGIAVVAPGQRDVYPAVARQVFDVSGAGDTVIATLALSLASGLPVAQAVPLANLAAGIVVSKVGTVPVTANELLSALMPEIELHASEKVLPLDRLQRRVSAWRSKGERVVFTNGCFDLLHVGHITLLENARLQGDRLIVAINSDASVSGLKGPTRPVVREADRGRVLAALASVDAVVVFGEPTPLELIEALRPDVIVKGGDYTEDTVVGAREVRAWGGVVRIVPTVEGFSTTRLIARAAQPEALVQ
jgi:D-beta-D-heptose 7-phosphate kinase / D-beta-D-heptose 1-phosphate adenosyltransferase